VAKEMGKEFLFTHALSLWRGIEAEGRAFPANNISVAVSGFGDVEDRVQGIQSFLVPGVQKTHNSLKVEAVKPSNTEALLGKRKREDEGIAKFLTKKEESTPPPEPKTEESVEGEEMDMGETYVCSKCHKHIPLQEMEEHEDYHMALELSKGSPVRAPPLSQLKTKPISKEEKKGLKKKTKPVEKGQQRLEFGM
jgi:DNA polymerase eta